MFLHRFCFFPFAVTVGSSPPGPPCTGDGVGLEVFNILAAFTANPPTAVDRQESASAVGNTRRADNNVDKQHRVYDGEEKKNAPESDYVAFSNAFRKMETDPDLQRELEHEALIGRRISAANCVTLLNHSVRTQGEIRKVFDRAFPAGGVLSLYDVSLLCKAPSSESLTLAEFTTRFRTLIQTRLESASSCASLTAEILSGESTHKLQARSHALGKDNEELQRELKSAQARLNKDWSVRFAVEQEEREQRKVEAEKASKFLAHLKNKEDARKAKERLLNNWKNSHDTARQHVKAEMKSVADAVQSSESSVALTPVPDSSKISTGVDDSRAEQSPGKVGLSAASAPSNGGGVLDTIKDAASSIMNRLSSTISISTNNMSLDTFQSPNESLTKGELDEKAAGETPSAFTKKVRFTRPELVATRQSQRTLRQVAASPAAAATNERKFHPYWGRVAPLGALMRGGVFSFLQTDAQDDPYAMDESMQLLGSTLARDEPAPDASHEGKEKEQQVVPHPGKKDVATTIKDADNELAAGAARALEVYQDSLRNPAALKNTDRNQTSAKRESPRQTRGEDESSAEKLHEAVENAEEELEESSNVGSFEGVSTLRGRRMMETLEQEQRELQRKEQKKKAEITATKNAETQKVTTGTRVEPQVEKMHVTGRREAKKAKKEAGEDQDWKRKVIQFHADMGAVIKDANSKMSDALLSATALAARKKEEHRRKLQELETQLQKQREDIARRDLEQKEVDADNLTTDEYQKLSESLQQEHVAKLLRRYAEFVVGEAIGTDSKKDIISKTQCVTEHLASMAAGEAWLAAEKEKDDLTEMNYDLRAQLAAIVEA